MSFSLKWLAVLVATSLIAAAVAGGAMYLQGRTRTRVMAEQISGGNSEAGRHAIARYGCGSCHVIPGIAGATGAVGPALGGIARRTTIAGRLPNDPAAMIRWLEHPQAIVRGNAMPDQGVTAGDARDMAAYLYTLK